MLGQTKVCIPDQFHAMCKTVLTPSLVRGTCETPPHQLCPVHMPVQDSSLAYLHGDRVWSPVSCMLFTAQALLPMCMQRRRRWTRSDWEALQRHQLVHSVVLPCQVRVRKFPATNRLWRSFHVVLCWYPACILKAVLRNIVLIQVSWPN